MRPLARSVSGRQPRTRATAVGSTELRSCSPGEVSGDEGHGGLGPGVPPRREGLLYYRLVEGAHRAQGVALVGAQHDPVGEERVVDGAAFAQELRVGGHPVIHRRTLPRRTLRGAFLYEHRDVVTRADRHTALINHDQRAPPPGLRPRR